MRESTSQILACIVSWFAVFLLVGLALQSLRPPNPTPIAAPAQEFSAERAKNHVRIIARVPHPIGSQANREVKDYLTAQLSSLGLTPQIFQGVGLDVVGSAIVAGRTQDVVGRLPGTENSQAILLVAHYDSMPRSPGAADDAASVAAILETVRALRSDRALKNDLIVLFSDGEEGLLLGAESFATSNPWIKDVGLVLNFEARGNRGPSLLFETSPGNHQLVKGFREAAPYPVGSSLFYALYKLLPNDTDFTIFHRLGLPGLNFAFGEGFDAYHSRLDTAENLSTASLQHHGSYALALTRYFGQLDLTKLREPADDEIFFNWFGTNLISYPEKWVIPEQMLISILIVLLVTLSFRKATIQPKRLILAVASFLALLVSVPGAMALAWKMIAYFLADRVLSTDSPGNSLLLSGTVLFGTAVAGFLLNICRRKFSVQEMSLAAMMLVCCFNWVVAVKLPAGSYLLFWPLLFSVAGQLIIQLLNYEERPASQLIGSLAGTSAALLLFSPVVYLVYVFFTLQSIVVVVVGGCIFMVCILSIPLMDRLVLRIKPWLAPALVFSVAIACWVSGAKLSGYTAEHPGHDTLAYSVNANDGSAKWISYDDVLDRWTMQFFGQGVKRQSVPNYLAGSARSVFTASASTVELLAPVATVESDTMVGDLHQLNLRIKSSRAADIIYLRFAKDIQGVSANIEGRDVHIQKHSNWLRLTLYGMADKEINLRFLIRAPSGIVFWVMDESAGLPASVPHRPDNLMAWYGSDVTLVCRMYSL